MTTRRNCGRSDRALAVVPAEHRTPRERPCQTATKRLLAGIGRTHARWRDFQDRVAAHRSSAASPCVAPSDPLHSPRAGTTREAKLASLRLLRTLLMIESEFRIRSVRRGIVSRRFDEPGVTPSPQHAAELTGHEVASIVLHELVRQNHGWGKIVARPRRSTGHSGQSRPVGWLRITLLESGRKRCASTEHDHVRFEMSVLRVRQRTDQ